MKQAPTITTAVQEINVAKGSAPEESYLPSLTAITQWLRHTLAVGSVMVGGVACTPNTTPPKGNVVNENPWMMPSKFSEAAPFLQTSNEAAEQQLFEAKLAAAGVVLMRELQELLPTATSKLQVQTSMNIHIPEYVAPGGLVLQIDNESVTFDKMNMGENADIFTAQEKPWIAITANAELYRANIGFFVLKSSGSSSSLSSENTSVMVTDLMGKNFRTLIIEDRSLRNRLTVLLEDWLKHSKKYRKMSALQNSEKTYSSFDALSVDLIARTVRFNMKSRNEANQETTILCTGFPDTERTMITTGHCVNNSYGNLDLYSYKVQTGGVAKVQKRAFPPSKYHVITTGTDLLAAVTFKEKVFDADKTFTFQSMPLRNEKYCAGHFVGYGNDERWAINSGNILTVDSYSKWSDVNYDIAKMQPGNSGGPIVNCRTGEVVGIVRTTNRDRTASQNIYVPPETLLTLISQIYIYENKP